MGEPINEEILKREGLHKYFAIELNQLVWSLLGKSNRTREEDELMVHAAHGSYFHWLKCGTSVNRQRGEWILSRVYSVLNVPERALFHAKRCREITDEYTDEMDDFDLAYADEAMARALACSGNFEGADNYRKQAKEKGSKISDDEARKIFNGDFISEPWYGI